MKISLKQNIALLEQMFISCDKDYKELLSKEINEGFFEDYSDVRILNSFLFNFSKIQDKIGAKIFKQLLFELKEIDDFSIPMIDALNILEKLNIINKSDWDKLREIRNLLAHEYPFHIEERIANIKITINYYPKLKEIFHKLKNAVK